MLQKQNAKQPSKKKKIKEERTNIREKHKIEKKN